MPKANPLPTIRARHAADDPAVWIYVLSNGQCWRLPKDVDPDAWLADTFSLHPNRKACT